MGLSPREEGWHLGRKQGKHLKHLHLWPNCHEEGLSLGLRYTISFQTFTSD